MLCPVPLNRGRHSSDIEEMYFFSRPRLSSLTLFDVSQTFFFKLFSLFILLLLSCVRPHQGKCDSKANRDGSRSGRLNQSLLKKIYLIQKNPSQQVKPSFGMDTGLIFYRRMFSPFGLRYLRHNIFEKLNGQKIQKFLWPNSTSR